MLSILFRAEGFSCSLNGLLGVNSFFYQKRSFFQLFFSPIFSHQNHGSETGSGFIWNAESGSVSGFIESGSTTLIVTQQDHSSLYTVNTKVSKDVRTCGASWLLRWRGRSSWRPWWPAASWAPCLRWTYGPSAWYEPSFSTEKKAIPQLKK